jgi:hypothetical protein
MRSMMKCHGVHTGVGTDRRSAVSSRRSITMGTMMTGLERVRRRGAVSGLAAKPLAAEVAWHLTFHPLPVVLAALLTAALVALLQES